MRRSIASLRQQAFSRFEILLAAPGPLDPADFTQPDERLRTVASPPGLASLWNAGGGEAAGKYVCFLIAGDELDPTYFEKCLFLLESWDLDLCASWEQRPDGVRQTGPISIPQLLESDHSAAAAVIRKSANREPALFDSSVPDHWQNWDLWLRLTHAGIRGHVIPEALVHPVEAKAGEPPAGSLPMQKYPLLSARLEDPTYNYWPPDPRLAHSVLVQPGEAPGGTSVLLAMPYLTLGGGEAIVSQICRQLKSLGFRIFVMTTLPTSEYQSDTTGWFREGASGIYALPGFLDTSLWEAFLIYLIQLHSIRVLWLVGSAFTYAMLPLLKRLFPDLAVVELLFNPVGHTANHLKYNYLIDHVVTEHDGMKNWLVEHGDSDDHVSVIPNGVDLEIYRPQPRKDWRTGRERGRASAFVVGYFGRLSEEKAPDILIEIAARLKKQAGGFEFLVCGTGPMEGGLRDLCEKHSLADTVHFLGFVSTPDYLPCCDVTVICSRLDGRPNLLMESLSMGIPVVASRVGAIPDMAPEGQGVRLCEGGDIDAFRRVILDLASNPAAYAQLSSAGQGWARDHFSLSDSGVRYAKLFHGLVRDRVGLARPLDLEEVAEATGLDPRSATQSTHPGKAGAWSRFAWSVLSPAHWVGNLRTLLMYRALRSDRKVFNDLQLWFDAGYYRREHPDAAFVSVPPLFHYLFYGFRDGCRPSPLFDTRYYLRSNPDVAAAGVNPLVHYLLLGRREGRPGMQRRPGPAGR
jgi:glycosyltransferase involved in cell wall biosynthesis